MDGMTNEKTNAGEIKKIAVVDVITLGMVRRCVWNFGKQVYAKDWKKEDHVSLLFMLCLLP
tara:strand:+ start:94 stop:276 length:183 start_codon:yes stop_codon:yes gene_type:complete